MQTLKKPVKKTPTKEKQKDEKLNAQEEKIKAAKKSTYNASTPRNSGSVADIYQKTPKKSIGSSKDYKTSPMKDYLKSSPSSISQISSSTKISTNKINTNSKPVQNRARTAKDLPFVNVTVNSPIVKRKLDIANKIDSRNKGKPTESRKAKDEVSDRNKKVVEKGEGVSERNRRVVEKGEEVSERKKRVDEKGDAERLRSKTRTLDETEVKELTLERIDNNEEMANLKQKLVAKPKAFYVGLGGDDNKAQNTKSDEDVSYEDDFESYESDFDSYHSESNSDHAEDSEVVGPGMKTDIEENEDAGGDSLETGEEASKDKDEENMLDSGNFDLREQRSAKSKPAAMEFILETEEDKISSLDEGFQEGSSAVSSMRTVHVEFLERPLFIDFNKSKQQKRKKRIVEQMMRRAKDILSMVTLHEMSFTLFEMKPISYDLYMATFGRSNYTQSAVQTFDDGITEEVQTDDVEMENKWTQHPIEFSKSDVYLNDNTSKKNLRNSEDYMSKFTSMFGECKKNNADNEKDYNENPLRMLLEQKNGAGSCEMLPYETYKSKLKSDFSTNGLGKFLKKVESKVSHILNKNKTVSENVIKSTLPYSSGYIGITTKNVPDDKSFLKLSKIMGLIFSEDKNNLILTLHRKLTNGILAGKSIVCLWDASVARAEPIKILVAIDNVIIGRFKGNSEGLLVAALEDGSIHLWDLSEEPTWRNEVVSPKTLLEEVKTEALTQTERDREWNLKNINAGYEQIAMAHALQACAYTSSAANLTTSEVTDRAVGLEFINAQAQDTARNIIGQVCSLQRLGILTIWTIVQEKSKSHDLGKAIGSKMKLEKTQTISLTRLLGAKEISDNPFNLNAGKKRMVKRKQEKTLVRSITRQKSAESDIDRPTSVASARKLLVERKLAHDWESGVVCGDLKIVQYDNVDRYLVAKNNGEVLSCTRSLGAMKVERLCVSSDTSSITCLDVSPHGPYFLAATDSGTVNLYSLVDARVLLTLDCRNGPPSVGPQADFKGRFVDAPRRCSGPTETKLTDRLAVSSVLWSRTNPCCIFTLHEGALACWELTHSDIYPKHTARATVACVANNGALALLTEEGDVQVHRLAQKNLDYVQLFRKYITLL